MKQIPLTQGKVAIVDDADFEYFNQVKWSAVKARDNWYAIRGNGTSMHREIMNAPSGMMIDHINGNGLDNRRENLRLCTNAENLRNRGKTKSNTSGYKGVTWHKGDGKYRAQMTYKGKVFHIGCFDNPVAAARAYDEKARELHGAFARTNF